MDSIKIIFGWVMVITPEVLIMGTLWFHRKAIRKELRNERSR